MQAGARVHDALQKAGGLLPDAESKSINQAQKLTDEAVVYVAKVGEEGADVTQASQTPAGNGGTEKGKSGLVNLNTATEAEFGILLSYKTIARNPQLIDRKSVV